MSFAHLHVHSQFSLLDGAIPIKKLAPAAAALGQPAVALTDHCNLYGAVTFHKSCKSEGLHPVFGAGIWVQPEGQASQDPAGALGGYHLVLLIKDHVGYQNLCALVTSAIFDGMYYKPRVDLDLLRTHKDGLIALTSGMRGPVRPHFAAERPELARAALEPLADIFGAEHLYLELQDVAFPGDDLANAGCRTLGAEFGLQTVVTNNVHYLRKTHAPTLDLLQCIGSGVSLNDAKRRRPITDQLYLKSEDELRELFPDDGAALDRTVEIADRCQYAFEYGKYYFPASTPPDAGDGTNMGQPDTDPNWAYFYKAFPPPMDFGLPIPESDDVDWVPGENMPLRPEGAGNINGYFEWYAKAGLRLRLDNMPEPVDEGPYWERLEEEFHIVENMPGGGFAAYFLIVAEFINWAKDQDIPVGPGRGSAAGSLAAWAMRITDIDPIRFDLLFERFLNPERVSMPDVDVDFCQDRREEVIEHTRQKYGTEYVAQIITYGKLQAKAAVRDVSRVCDLTFNDADRVAKLIPNELGISLDKALAEEALSNLREIDPRVRRIYDLARSVEGLTRQTGIHAAGVVVADRPIVELSPLYRDGPEGGPVVQYDMKSAESIGLIKFDFLGLKTLDQIRDAVRLIERNTGERIDMAAIPVDDPATYKLLHKGDGLGVFQVESSGMRELLTKLKPDTLDDVIALVALYRPGPLNSGMVDDFIERKHGRKAVVYPVPALEPILKDTYGVIVYQEQVMQTAQVMASYSLGQADLLRRAMGKKQHDKMAEHKILFCKGAEENGFDVDKAAAIFDLLAQFAAYGFNKSHSAAYGYISYQTAWLKANHRAEYMAALMTIESSNTDKILVYIGDCKRAKLNVLGPDVNESEWGFNVPADDRNTIRYGLGAIKGVGRSAVEAFMDARRDAGGRFKDLMDCMERLDFARVNKKVLENLVKAGAFDWTGDSRAALYGGLEAAISSAQRTQHDKASGQVGLFGALTGSSAPKFRLPQVADWSVSKELRQERDAVGFFLSGHPVVAYKALVDKMGTCRISGLHRRQGGEEVRIAGMPATVRVIRTKRGDKMAFVTLDDETEAIECVFFSEPWANSVREVKDGGSIMVSGVLEKSPEGIKLMAESVQTLADLQLKTTRLVNIHLKYAEARNKRLLKQLLGELSERAGSCPAHLRITRDGHSEAVVTLPEGMRLHPDEELRDAVDALFRRRGVVEYR